METELFINAGEHWTQEEENKLNKLYNEDMLDIMEISQIHCRAPSGILTRLKHLKYITHRTSARGYDIYKKSDFYKQSVLTNKDKYKKDLTEKINTTNTGNDIKELQNSVKEIKHEINELKFCIKQFIEMLTMQSYEEDDA
jgi:hypothetical protein